MKKPLFFILALLSLSMATAQKFTVDDIAYNVIPGEKMVEVTKKYPFYSGAVTIPETVTHRGTTYTVTAIGEWAFNDCRELTAVDIPNTVTIIKGRAFTACIRLTSIELPNSLITIEGTAFLLCESLTSINIPNSVTSIGSSAFDGCKSLSSVTLGESIRIIGSHAFAYCDSIRSIDIPDSVVYIGEWAFYTCPSLETVTLGNSLLGMGELVFGVCVKLTSVTVKQSTPVSMVVDGSHPFSKGLTLYVPRGSEAAYKATNFWKDFNIKSKSPVIGSIIESPSPLDDGIMTVWPIPADNTLHIKENSSAKLEQATLLNFNGEVVSSSKENTLNVSSLDEGIYTLRLNTDQGVITKKVVKK